MARIKKTETDAPKEKKISLFDVLNEIESKQRDWNELGEDFHKAYSQFMINRFISSKKNYVGAIELLTKYKLPDEIHYEYCRSLLNQQKHYFDYKAYKNTKEVDELAIYALRHEYEISLRDAQSYYDMLMDETHTGGVETLNNLKSKWEQHYKTFGDK